MANNDQDKIDTEKIRGIAEQVMSGTASGVAASEDGSVEYKFAETIPKTSLVFLEDDEEDDNDKEVLSIDSTALDSEEETTDELAVTIVESEAKPREAFDEEFEIPDEFVVTETYSESMPYDMAPRVWKTYVPRFTEVTERTYRMKDEPKTANASGAGSDAAEQVSQSTVIVETENTGNSDPIIAEIDSEASTSIQVNVDGDDKRRRDTINVFKFGGGEKMPEVEISEEDIERREISDLTGHIWSGESADEDDISTSDAEDLDITGVENTASYDTVEEANVYSEEITETYSDTAESDELPENERPAGWDYDPMRSQDRYPGEYCHYEMRDAHKDKFLDSILSTRLRLLVAAILSIGLLIFENLSIFGIDLIKVLKLERYPAALSFFDGAVVVALLLISLPETIRALRSVAFGRIVPELGLPIVAIAAISYTIALTYNSLLIYPMLGFVYSIMVCFGIYATYCLHSSDFLSFKEVSDKGVKTVVDSRYTRELERENIALDGRIDEHKSKIGRDFKCSFVSDVKKKSDVRMENHRVNFLSLTASLGIAILAGLLMIIIKGDWVYTLWGFAFVLCLSYPAFSLMSHKLPLFALGIENSTDMSVLIGEGSVYDYSKVDCVTFLDTEIFGEDEVSFKSISLSDRHGDFRAAMRLMSSLFSPLGGPLAKLFFNSLGKSFDDAETIVVEDDGVRGTISGNTVMAGSYEYMIRHGVAVQRDESSHLENVRIMYAAESGVVFAKFSIQYNFSEEFAETIALMKKHKITPLVYTNDPNINNKLMRFMTAGEDLIRVMKLKAERVENEKVYRRLSSGLVTHGGKREIIKTIISAKRYTHFQWNLARTELTVALSGAGLALMILLLGMSLLLPQLIVGLWQIAWSLVLSIATHRSFNTAKQKKTKKVK